MKYQRYCSKKKTKMTDLNQHSWCLGEICSVRFLCFVLTLGVSLQYVIPVASDPLFGADLVQVGSVVLVASSKCCFGCSESVYLI